MRMGSQVFRVESDADVVKTFAKKLALNINTVSPEPPRLGARVIKSAFALLGSLL
jgi:hypothetical protein